METWATFSIVDHRKPIYRQALALFERSFTRERSDRHESAEAFLSELQSAAN